MTSLTGNEPSYSDVEHCVVARNKSVPVAEISNQRPFAASWNAWNGPKEMGWSTFIG